MESLKSATSPDPSDPPERFGGVEPDEDSNGDGSTAVMVAPKLVLPE